MALCPAYPDVITGALLSRQLRPPPNLTGPRPARNQKLRCQ